jgi:hypothetical protein
MLVVKKHCPKNNHYCNVMFDCDAMFSSKLLKCLFCFHHFDARQVLHEMDKAETREVVHEDGCGMVPLGGKFTL